MAEEDDVDALRAKAEAGDTDAISDLARRLLRDGDSESAEHWLRRGAEAEDAKAMTLLGALLWKKESQEEALVCFAKAASTGYGPAMTRLGALYAEQKDWPEAQRWASKAVDAGGTLAMELLAETLRQQGDPEGAERWSERAAEHGVASAMMSLARLRRQRGDSPGAQDWYQRAAEAGRSDGMEQLAYLLRENGDMAAAEFWYRKAAEAGRVSAMSGLGLLLMGRGSTAEAEEWWLRAATGGDKTAMYNLATALLGHGDMANAEHWYSEAVRAGNEGAAEALERLRTKRDVTDRWLDAVRFDTFGWPMVNNTDDLRQWLGEGASLGLKYLSMPPDMDVSNMEELRSAIREMFQLVEAGELRLEDLEVPEELQEMMKGHKRDVGELIDLDVFEVYPAHCLSVTTRHRKDDHIHYGTQFLVLFADRFWLLGLEVEEEAGAVGEREAAVAHELLESGETAVGESFDPYERRWDGLIPIEQDALTRLRFLEPRIRDSLSFSDDALALPRLDFPGA